MLVPVWEMFVMVFAFLRDLGEKELGKKEFFVCQAASVCLPARRSTMGFSSCPAQSAFGVSNEALRLVQCGHLLVFGCPSAGLNFIEPKANYPKQHQLYVNTRHAACFPSWHRESERFLSQPRDLLKLTHQADIRIKGRTSLRSISSSTAQLLITAFCH